MDRNTLSHYGWIVIVIIILSCMIIMSTPLGKFWARGFEATWAGFGQTSNNAMDVIKPNPNPNPDTPDPTPTPDEPDPTPITPPEDYETYEEEDGDYIYTYMEVFDGWDVIVKSDRLTKTEYQPILTEIKGKPITAMNSTFRNCNNLTVSPTIPSTVKYMSNTYDKCYSLTAAPVIPDGVEDMNGTFCKCTSLIEAPNIPSTVKLLSDTFYGCTSLKTVSSVIPETVESMGTTFYGCTSLTGTITINANPGYYYDCFKGTKKAIILTGTSSSLIDFMYTSTNNNITIQR